jgi:hypothetical protein
MGPSGRPAGAAFLVTPDVLLTAAHVVSLAAGNAADATERPGGEVYLSFAAAPDAYLRAEVVHWVPPGPASPEDVAGLRLVDPAPDGVAPAPLTDLRAPLDRRVTTLGFPSDAPHGGWGHGRLAGADARDLVQIDTLPDSQFTIEQGFSGTPVWDVADGAVAGLVVEGWTRGRRSGFMIPTAVLLAAWPWLAERVWPASPFRGLTPFTERDATVFFGRDDLVARIVELTATTPALTVVGPSGVGKSSLLNAGVLPRLRERAGLVVAAMRPSQAQTPLRAVALALARAAEPEADPLGRGERVDALADRLARGLAAEVVGDVLEARGGDRLLLVVDQFEEILIAADEESAQVADVLAHCLAPASRLAVLSALRADFLGRALQHRGLAELVADTRLVTVGELGQGELRVAIEQPVRRSRMVRYEAGLVDRLLTDVGPAPGRLPLLQFTLAMLWDAQESGVLTHRAYDALGGVDSALARHAEAVWHGLGGAERTAAGRLLVQLLYPLSGNAGFVRRTAPRVQLDDAQWAAAQRLAADRTRLVVLREQDAGQVVELAHDALVTHWRRLAELGEADREFREWQEGLRQRIRQWQRRRRPADRLLAGADLRDALRWRAGRGEDLGPDELAYLEASRRERTRRWRKWIQRAGAAAVVAALLLMQRQLEIAGDAANTMVRNASTTDSYAHLRTVLRAYRTRATDRSESEVELAYGQFARVDRVLPDYTARPLPPAVENGRTLPTEPPSAIAQKVSADGRTLVTTDPQENVTVWRVDGARVTGHAIGQVADRVTVSRDGRYVAYLQGTIDPDPLQPPVTTCHPRDEGECVYLYDTATGRSRQIGVLNAFPFAEIPVLRFDPSGSVLAAVFGTAMFRQRLLTWDVTTGRQRDDVTVPGEMDTVHDMWLAPGGLRLLLDADIPSHPGSRLFNRVLAALDPAAPALTPLTGDTTGDFAVSGDGNRVAGLVTVRPTDVRHQKLVVWDVASGRPVAEVPSLSEDQSLGQVALDANGDRVSVTGFSGDVAFWRVGDATAQPVTLHTHGWTDVLPLGTGPDAPLLLVRDDVVGLALPAPGSPTPVRRLSDPLPYVAGTTSRADTHPGQWYGEMCAALASDVPVTRETTDLPAGAYPGPLCG